MKKLIHTSLAVFVIVLITSSCKKDSTTPTPVAAIAATWQTGQWGGVSGTVQMVISTSNSDAIMTEISQTASQTTYWNVGDTLFANITPTGNNTYSCIGRFMSKGVAYHTKTQLVFQSNNMLTANYSTDPVSGITPPQYTWNKN